MIHPKNLEKFNENLGGYCVLVGGDSLLGQTRRWMMNG